MKLYGNHYGGQFNIYISPRQEEKIKLELGITNARSGYPFELRRFLKDLNASFPESLSLREKIVNLRRHWKEVRPLLPEKIVKDEDKTVLIGEKRLTRGKPQEKTLRKLYLHTEGEPDDITELIKCLKAANMTVAWTTEDSGIKSTDIRELISRTQ